MPLYGHSTTYTVVMLFCPRHWSSKRVNQSIFPYPYPYPYGSKPFSNPFSRKAFYRCLKQAGIRQVRFHDLRHSYAALLIQKGAHPKYIHEQMGHSSIQVTMDIYGHLFGGEYRHLASQLDDPRLDHIEAEPATQAQPALAGEGKACVNY